MLTLENVTKEYISGTRVVRAVSGISLSINAGDSMALVGPSGSGKSTLLALAAGLDHPTIGMVKINGRNLVEMAEGELSRLRLQSLGFIFQNFQLLPSLTALQNVALPAELNGDPAAEAKAKELLTRVGLADRASHYPGELSGGEQQRTAIARAFINSPTLIIADEPTGNLDQENAQSIQDLLFQFNQERHTALLIATHDLNLADRCQIRLSLRAGHPSSSATR